MLTMLVVSNEKLPTSLGGESMSPPEEVAYLEECYVPHPIVGAINSNPPQGTILLDEKR